MEHNTSNFGLDLRTTFSATNFHIRLYRKNHSHVLPSQTSCDPDPLLTAWLNACQQYISTIPPRILMNIPAPVRSRAGNTCNQSANNRR